MPLINNISSDFTQTVAKIKAKQINKKQHEYIFDEILYVAGVDRMSPSQQYSHIDDILEANDYVYNALVASGTKVDVSVTGKITERICQIALDAAAVTRYCRPPQSWDWIGDFELLGTPFNVFVSVKSYKAKERLIVSGTGQLAAPVIGYGLFDSTKEWSPNRVKQYKQRGFLAIYMPKKLYTELSLLNETNPNLSQKERKKYSSTKGYPVTEIKNIYERPLIRVLNDFADDIANVYQTGKNEVNLEKF